MVLEIDAKLRVLTGDGSEACSVYVVINVVFAILQSAQFHRTCPVLREKRIVHRIVAANYMSFGGIEANVVQTSEILAA